MILDQQQMNPANKVRVAVNGYGVIGKRVADAVARQDDMELVGVADISDDWRPRMAMQKGFRLYGATEDHAGAMRNAGLDVAGNLDDPLAASDLVVDCTPKKIAVVNVAIYRQRGIKFIVQGGEKHEVTGHSFVAEASYASALNRDSTRVVSCNTTSIVRTLTALKRTGLLHRARGTLMRRATDPWESHLGGIMNTLVPEPEIPSHQGPDAQSVDPDLDIITMAVKVPETLAHLHYWSVQLTRPASKDEVLDAFSASSRITLIRMDAGLTALDMVKELMAEVGRSMTRGTMLPVLTACVWDAASLLFLPGRECSGLRSVEAIRAVLRLACKLIMCPPWLTLRSPDLIFHAGIL